MSRSKLIANIIICVILLIACVTLAFWSHTSYRGQTANIEHLEQLEEDLKETTLVLKKTESQLDAANKKGAVLSAESANLTKEINQQKERIREIEQAKQALDIQIAAISSEKDELKDKLSKEKLKREQADQERLILKERDLREEIDSEKEKFLIQKEALLKQVEAQDAMLKNLARKNEGLLGALTKAKGVLDKLHREKEIIEENERLSAELNKNKKALEETLKLHYNLALTYEETRRYKEALVEYKKALEIAPDDPDVHYNLAILYDEHIHNEKKAIEHYQRYLELCPQAPDANKVIYWISKAKEELEFE